MLPKWTKPIHEFTRTDTNRADHPVLTLCAKLLNYVPVSENIEVIKRFIDELWNGRNLKVANEIFAPECLTHQLRSGSEISSAPRDPETIKQHVNEWVEAFPDLRFTLEQAVADEDRVASQITMHGTHRGTWMGVPPTFKEIQIRMMTIHRIESGKIVEDWVLVDSLGLFQQLGLVPSREEIFGNFQ